MPPWWKPWVAGREAEETTRHRFLLFMRGNAEEPLSMLMLDGDLDYDAVKS